MNYLNSCEIEMIHFSLPATPTGWFEYRYSILSDGKLALIRTARDIDAAQRRWREEHKDEPSLFLWEDRVRLSIFDGIIEQDVVELVTGNWPLFDRLADGRWVVVSSRVSGHESNARLFSPNGQPAGKFFAGDGVGHVRCDSDGSIWIGYFDEGIYAHQNDDGSWPISSSGIVRFSSDGQLLWKLDIHNLPIDDNNAFAVTGNTLWACPYSDFPIVRVQDGAVRTWNNIVQGARAIAIDGDHVMLAGGYKRDINRIALLRLDDDQARNLGELRLADESGSGIWLMQGVGSTIHFVREGCWSRLSVSEVYTKLINNTGEIPPGVRA